MSEPIAETVLSLDGVHALALRVLTHNGMSDAHARAIANVITQGQRDECHSHGVYRLLVCVRSLKKGKVDPHAVPTLRRLSSSIVSVGGSTPPVPISTAAGSALPVEISVVAVALICVTVRLDASRPGRNSDTEPRTSSASPTRTPGVARR